MEYWLHIVGGFTLWVLVLLLLTYTSWLWATVHFLQAGIVFSLFLLGLGLLVLGMSELNK